MTASLTKTHNNVAKNVAARGTSAENATIASTSENTEHSPSMDSTTTIAEDTGDKSHLPPAGKGKRKAIDPAAGSSKQRLRAGGVSGFGNEDVEMKTTFSSKLCFNTHTLLSMPFYSMFYYSVCTFHVYYNLSCLFRFRVFLISYPHLNYMLQICHSLILLQDLLLINFEIQCILTLSPHVFLCSL
jgi:hypothetical protein